MQSKTATPLPAHLHVYAMRGTRRRPKAFEQIRHSAKFARWVEGGRPPYFVRSQIPVCAHIAKAAEHYQEKENAK